MAHSREDVVASVRASFPKESRARALELLDMYGVAAHERERERVQLAILKLSDGNEEKLRQNVDAAKRDYRNFSSGQSTRKRRRSILPKKDDKCASCSRSLDSSRLRASWNERRCPRWKRFARPAGNPRRHEHRPA